MRVSYILSVLAVLVTLQFTPIAIAAPPDPAASTAAVEALQAFLNDDELDNSLIAEQPFATVALTQSDAEKAKTLLWDQHVQKFTAEHKEEFDARVIKEGDLEMPYFYKIFGDKPEGGRGLYISMHGGGNAAARVNDSQWENQKRLYEPEEGVYLAPRAPTNTWNLWHEGHIDTMFARLIADLIVFEDVNPNKVYILGYSAGGDGVYQLAPRMADFLAAASMMAGHPNEATPEGLRNIGFIIQVGGNDRAYNRNTVAVEWGQKITDLQKTDPEGYKHETIIREGKPHWMDREDAMALPWMAKFTRDPFPKRVVWKQDDITHTRFYWLAIDEDQQETGVMVTASVDGQNIKIESTDLDHLKVRLHDKLVNLDEPVTITIGEKKVEATPTRTIGVMAKTLAERGDPASIFTAELTVR